MGFLFGKKCPKCDSHNIKVVKPGLMRRAQKGSAFLVFGPLALLMKDPKNLNVCRKCGFSWEDR
jgi:predicted Zn-ribbon and HTH transcriptional regulator